MIEALDGISAGASRGAMDEDDTLDRVYSDYYNRMPSTPSSSGGYPRSSASEVSPSNTPSSSYRKRHSNNLFGSGRMRDANYLRAVRTSPSVSSSLSTAPSSLDQSAIRSHGSYDKSLSSKDIEEERDSDKTPVGSDKTPTSRQVSLASSLQRDSRLQFSPAQQKRMSLALDSALSAIAVDPEDDIIVAPRSSPRTLPAAEPAERGEYRRFAVSLRK